MSLDKSTVNNSSEPRDTLKICSLTWLASKTPVAADLKEPKMR